MFGVNGVASATFSAVASSTNTQLMGATLFTSPTLGPGNFSGTASSGLNLPAPYALTEFVTLNFSGAGGSVSGDFNLNATVPEGGETLGLLGVAVVGIAAVRRKFAS
jgi:hypothetical protein